MTNEKGMSSNILFGVIIVLLVIIAVMGYFLGKSNSTPGGDGALNTNYEDVSVRVIKDERDTLLDINAIVDSIKGLPSLAQAEFTIVDFSDTGVREFMEENNITKLPAMIFSTNNFNVSLDPIQTDASGMPAPKINSFLTQLPNGEFSLELGAEYDPFVERSDRGFRLLTEEQYNNLFFDGVHYDGNTDAKIAWLEYSDLQCSFCAKLYSDGTPESILEKYPNDVKIAFNHFPIFAPDSALALECVGRLNTDEMFYSVLESSFSEQKSSPNDIVDFAVALGANENSINECIDNDEYKDVVDNQMQMGQDYFTINGTPGNVIVNTETREYEVVSGAQPVENFEKVIDELL